MSILNEWTPRAVGTPAKREHAFSLQPFPLQLPGLRLHLFQIKRSGLVCWLTLGTVGVQKELHVKMKLNQDIIASPWKILTVDNVKTTTITMYRRLEINPLVAPKMKIL